MLSKTEKQYMEMLTENMKQTRTFLGELYDREQITVCENWEALVNQPDQILSNELLETVLNRLNDTIEALNNFMSGGQDNDQED